MNFLIVLVITSVTGVTFLLTSLYLCYKNRKSFVINIGYIYLYIYISMCILTVHLFMLSSNLSEKVVIIVFARKRRKIVKTAKPHNANDIMPPYTRWHIKRAKKYRKHPKIFRRMQRSNCLKQVHLPSHIPVQRIRYCIRLCIMNVHYRKVVHLHHQRY